MGPSVERIRTERGVPDGCRKKPVSGMKCSVVFRPYTPQKDAGRRSEPVRSEPTSRGVSPAATAAAAPPLEPPGVRSGSHGFTVRPKIGFELW